MENREHQVWLSVALRLRQAKLDLDEISTDSAGKRDAVEHLLAASMVVRHVLAGKYPP